MKGNQCRLVIKGGTVVTPFRILEDCHVVAEDGKISALIQGQLPKDLGHGGLLFEASGNTVTPGLIDLHTHGGVGQDCLGGDLEKISRFKLCQGVTGYLSTLVAAPLEMIYQSADSVLEFNSSAASNGAQILGINIEGLYLNPEWRGAQPLAYLRKPNAEECKELLRSSHGLVKLMTVAPEFDGSLEVIEVLSKNGVTPSLGHSGASAKDIDQSITRGLRHVTHIFNAMDGRRFSEPGVRGAGCAEVALVRNELSVEVIGETTHVNPVLMEILFRTKGPDRIIVITDSLSVAGLPPGRYQIGVLSLVLEEGATVARLEDEGLAGSVVPLNKAARTFFENTSATLNQVIQMVTYNPARLLGIESRKGSIEVGKDADITIFDENLDTVAVFIGGKLAYYREDTG